MYKPILMFCFGLIWTFFALFKNKDDHRKIDNLKDEDDLKNEDNPKNEEDLKNEDNHKN